MACKPTAYVYTADIHCVPCTLQAFGSDHHGHATPDATDQEGNPLGVVCGRISSEGFDSLQVCGTCGSFLCPHCGAVAEDDPGHGPDDFCWNCRACRYCGVGN